MLQIYCLSDFSSAAIVHRYPQERVSKSKPPGRERAGWQACWPAKVARRQAAT